MNRVVALHLGKRKIIVCRTNQRGVWFRELKVTNRRKNTLLELWKRYPEEDRFKSGTVYTFLGRFPNGE